MPLPKTFEMQVSIRLEHYTGPVVNDPQHLANWLCHDRQDFNAPAGFILMDVCPACVDPEDCEHTKEDASSYRVRVDGVDDFNEVKPWQPATTRSVSENSLREKVR